MDKFFIVLILSIFISSFESKGQETEIDYEVSRREKIKFSNKLDSLFLENKYERIVDLCNQPHPNYLSSICTYNLIGTYYFLGDSVKAWDLLNKEIEEIKAYPDANAYSLSNIFSNGDYTSFKKFLIYSTVKFYLLNLIDSFYKTEPVSDKENGMKLLHLLIEDQWIRRTSSLYDKLSPERKFVLPSQMDSMQAIQTFLDHSTKVFKFYKEQNKVFSKSEVGRIYYLQLMLFFHEQDLTRRKYYYDLVKQGVKNEAMKIEDQMNFEIGTLYIKMGIEAFFKHREEIQEEYRKKYALPHFRIRLM